MTNLQDTQVPAAEIWTETVLVRPELLEGRMDLLARLIVPLLTENDRNVDMPCSLNSTNTGTNLFVSGLSMDVRNEDLEGIFSKYGKVLKCEVMFDPRTRESRGFGFVNFANVEDADDALTLNGADLLGRPLMVQKARRQRPRTPTPGEYRGPIKEILYDRRRDDRYSRGGRSSDHDPYASRERFDRPRDRYDSRERDYEREYDRYNGRGGGDRYDREGDRGRRW
ncbi:hypothetical protein BATDEDRAFT_23541 [Batrachochytrium dendrobatidis JAM81]|uniref:RRM domain-containing protein n=2 Tax=Batrachochytrium dendrobatidis TaxID=109871 RepID=F4NXL8_BATDJ|nr:uncharacterized protein BATDEDRAFT_23541 [Batrachochytrium dendrobatidis JAM81]EGF81866.1 hypothetical protein BATDEDRAFT_23541 [Batrachochytrium dendrobatidis JAM81]|eukprot:XP_006677310.1 hypothetical protein BATDEDRAFT_23541 [Batrachochytrium dendrobatidis JAM81]